MSSSSNKPIRRWDDSDSSSDEGDKVVNQRSLPKPTANPSQTQPPAETKIRSYPKDVSRDSFPRHSNRDKKSTPSQYTGGDRRQAKSYMDPQRKGVDDLKNRGPGTIAHDWKDMAKHSQKFGTDSSIPIPKTVDGSAWMAQRQMLQHQKEGETQKRKLEEEQQHANSLKMKHKHQFDALKTILEVDKEERKLREDVVAVAVNPVTDSGKGALDEEPTKRTSLEARLSQMAVSNTNTTGTTSKSVESKPSSILSKEPRMFSKQQQQPQPPVKADKIVTRDKVDSKLVAVQEKKPLELSSSLTVKVVDTIPTNPPPKQIHSSLQQSLLDMQHKLNPTQESQDSQPDKPKEQRKNKAEPIVVNEKEEETHQGDDDMEKEDLDRNKRTGRGGRGGGRHGFNRGRGTSSGRSSKQTIHDVNPPHSLEESRVSSTVASTSHDMVRPVPQSTKPSSSTNQSIKDSAGVDIYEYQSSQVDTVKRDKGHTPRFQHKQRHSNTQGQLQSDGTVRLTKGPSYKMVQTPNTNLKSADSDKHGQAGEMKPCVERGGSVDKINVDDIKESIPTEEGKRKERTGSTHHGKFKGGRGGSHT